MLPRALLTRLNSLCARISWIWKSCVRADMNSRFRELLQGTYINRPDEKVLRRIRQDFPKNLLVVEDTEDALYLYTSVKEMPGTSTRRHMETQNGLFLNGPLG